MTNIEEYVFSDVIAMAEHFGIVEIENNLK
jgi:hypothetical protein